MEKKCENCRRWRCEPEDQGLGWCEHPTHPCVARGSDEICPRWEAKGEEPKGLDIADKV